MVMVVSMRVVIAENPAAVDAAPVGIDQRQRIPQQTATARVVTDPDERQPLIDAAAQRWGRTDIPAMLQHSPLIVLHVDGDAPDRRVDA